MLGIKEHTERLTVTSKSPASDSRDGDTLKQFFKMKAKLRKYKPKQDFTRIRDFLVKTYPLFDRLLNWRIERWNYARYFVAPFLGNYGQKEPQIDDSLKAIRFWEDTIGVWESDDNEIVGVVNMEYPDPGHPGFGEAFLQRHPKYTFLLDEMLDYAEATLVNRRTNMLFIYVYDYDKQLEELVQKRGYRIDQERVRYDSEFIVGDLPEKSLPEGYLLKSMAQESNIEFKRELFGRSFNHTDPAEWPSAFSYEELQRAPDYRKDLDLHIVDPNGRYAAGCIAWYDGYNRMGILEPVGTHPDFRRLGLGKEVVLEGIRRLARLGANKVWVGSGQRFYEAIGFEKTCASYRWTRKLS
jgi:predicted N-acetyltransferase YhbS/RimJ/RimL family protein N-acetyltransferase